jgi:murein DD-endopeptidase MepM/ murein hydrolase activator NlpD
MRLLPIAYLRTPAVLDKQMNIRSKKSRGKSFVFTSLLVILTVVAVGGFVLFFEGDKPVVSLEGTGEYLGRTGQISLAAVDTSSGIKSITVWAEQKDVKKALFTVVNPRTRYTGAVGPREVRENISIDTAKEGFADGELKITVEVRDFSFRGWFQGNRTVITKTVMVDTVPPHIQILHSEKYIIPGGSGIAIYRLTGADSRHGVVLNDYFNPGFLVGDGREDVFICYFGVPYNTEKINDLYLLATDKAGNSSKVAFTVNLQAPQQKKDDINVSDGFLEAKIPEFQQHYPEMSGENIDKYLIANSTVRDENNKKISQLCANPDPKRYWQGSFNRMPGSPRAGFADHRSYFYKGQLIDKQVHLGVDIASTQHAEVRAANKGRVIYAAYLGIYGNMVMVDHGQGVFSLYSHLSQITVSVDTMVDQATVIGLTGTTGMAGGDHLHFSMVVNGVFVTPKEWWDKHWISVTIEEPLVDSKF